MFEKTFNLFSGAGFLNIYVCELDAPFKCKKIWEIWFGLGFFTSTSDLQGMPGPDDVIWTALGALQRWL